MERLTHRVGKQITEYCEKNHCEYCDKDGRCTAFDPTGDYIITPKGNEVSRVCLDAFLERLADLEDKLESGQLVDTTPYIVEIKSDIPFKYKVIKPTIVRRNVEMCSSRESAEKRIAKLPKKLAEPIDAEQFTKVTAKAILQNLYKFAKDGTRNEDTGYACAFYRIIEKLLAGAKHYGVEIEK